MLENQLPFRLKGELEHQAPNNWDSLYQMLARRLADDLLQKLEGLPSPEGRLLGELRDEAIQAIQIKGA